MTLKDCFKHILDKEELTSDEETIIEKMMDYSRLSNDKLIGVLVSQYEIPVKIKVSKEFRDFIISKGIDTDCTSDYIYSVFSNFKRNAIHLEMCSYYDSRMERIIGNMAKGTNISIVLEES